MTGRKVEEKTAAAAETKDTWQDQAQVYEKFTGGITRRLASTVIDKHLPPLTCSSRILDSASGPGVVTELILDRAAAAGVDPPPRITAIDVAPGMIRQFKEKQAAFGWTTTECAVMDVTELTGLSDGAYDAVIMNFALFALPRAAHAVAEMKRVLKPGGKAIVTTWKYASTTEVLEQACQEVRPQDLHRVWPMERKWVEMETLRDALVEGGFSSSDVEISSETDFWVNKSVEALVEALTSPFWMRITEGWPDEAMAKWKPAIRKAAGEPEEDGFIRKKMVAWVGVARKAL